MKKDNGIKKDIGLVLGSIIAFYLALIGAGWMDNKLGFQEAYTLVDVASLGLKVAVASALAWIVKRLVFTNTLGKDFGDIFDSGWNEMSKVEKSRWIIGTFLVIFGSIIYASSS